MALLIRHGKKKWTNGRKPLNIVGSQFDPPLIPGQSFDLTGIERPTQIICSPFLRCRQTAALLANGASIVIDSDLREYLGNWHRRDVSVNSDTQRHIREPLVESFDEMKSRVLQTINKGYFKYYGGDTERLSNYIRDTVQEDLFELALGSESDFLLVEDVTIPILEKSLERYIKNYTLPESNDPPEGMYQ